MRMDRLTTLIVQSWNLPRPWLNTSQAVRHRAHHARACRQRPTRGVGGGGMARRVNVRAASTPCSGRIRVRTPRCRTLETAPRIRVPTAVSRCTGRKPPSRTRIYSREAPAEWNRPSPMSMRINVRAVTRAKSVRSAEAMKLRRGPTARVHRTITSFAARAAMMLLSSRDLSDCRVLMRP